MVDKVRKHFVRIVTDDEISRDDIVDFFDVVQSVVPTKVFSSFDGTGNKVKAEVVHYESDDETGFFFEQLKQLQQLLGEIFEISPDENQEKKDAKTEK